MPSPPEPQFVGRSKALRSIEQDIASAARSDAKVLLTGESGVGKEVVAQLIHTGGKRRGTPLVSVNCAGVPDTLLASELFGHMRGSFTDAHRDRRGWLEQANGGTILLDEVGEMSLAMQAMLLRFLDNGEIQPVGSSRPARAVDVRVISATNRRLLDRVKDGAFREDLFYRLNVIHIDIPPLRDRREDIPLLMEHFLRHYGDANSVESPMLSYDAQKVLQDFDWSGNVRQLRNVAERLIVSLKGRTEITPVDLPREVLVGWPSGHAAEEAVHRERSRPAKLFEQVVGEGQSFWTAVVEPFMARDLTRGDVRAVVARGVELVGDHHKALAALFNVRTEDARRFASFLRKYQCHVPKALAKVQVPTLDRRGDPVGPMVGD